MALRAKKQSDAEFLLACAISVESPDAGLAIALRKELASWFVLETDELLADTCTADYMHPRDSMDMLDVTLELERVIGVPFEPEEVLNAFLPMEKLETLSVAEWIRRVLDMTRAHGRELPKP